MEQDTRSNAKEIMARLAEIQADMDYVREHIEDVILTEDDLESIEEADKDYAEGKTIPLEDLKKELDL